ncbi:MAG: serine/threonine protein kinase [Nannocystaceae bacterium]|nr:serine/threonine protein kinase [Nannocystaceae bacterium]
MADAATPRWRLMPAGTRLGRYLVGQRLAVGGMGEIYAARAEGVAGFEKMVVLKLVHPAFAADPEFVRMLQSEARLAALLSHPNVVQVFDLGFECGEYFIAMAYVHGKSARELLRETQDPMPLACALHIVDRVAAALTHAHDMRDDDGEPLGILHRDVSPGNVMVGYDGTVALLDFGIAKAAERTKVTRTGTIKGKAGYMSPEQVRGQTLDRRTDVFSLGIVLYELSTGWPAFSGDSDFTMMNKIVSGDWVRPRGRDAEFPVELEAIIERALAGDVDKRFPTTAALQAALSEFAESHVLHGSPEALARYVQGLFGHPARPIVELGVEPPDVATRETVATAVAAMEPAQRAGWQRWAMGAAVLAVVGGGTWAMRTSTPERGNVVSEETSPRQREALEQRHALEPASAELGARRDAPVQTNPVQPMADSPDVASETEVAPSVLPEPVAHTKPRTNKTKSRRVRAARKEPAEASASGDNNLLPPSLRP